MNQESKQTFSFRKPLGAVLCGGGALGAWQAGMLEALSDRGITFDKVTGFSAGAINGSHYYMGWKTEFIDRWRYISQGKPLQWSPRLRPLSLFSDGPLRHTFEDLEDEATAKERGRCELEVITLRLNDARHCYFRFGPKGRPQWHGPMVEKLVASCSIPLIFPAVTIQENGGSYVHIDGGVPGRDQISFDFLADCRDVIFIELVRPEEVGRRKLMPWSRRDQRAREMVRRHMDDGVAALKRLKNPPRIFRLYPSRILDFSMLRFHPGACGPAVDLGIADGRQFLMNPAALLEPAAGPASSASVVVEALP